MAESNFRRNVKILGVNNYFNRANKFRVLQLQSYKNLKFAKQPKFSLLQLIGHYFYQQ